MTALARGIRNGLAVSLPCWLLLALTCGVLHAQQTALPWGPDTTDLGDRWRIDQGTLTTLVTRDSLPPRFVIKPLPSTTPKGIPFGCSGCLLADEPPPVTFSLDGYSAGLIIKRITDARAFGMRLMLNVTGGAHSNYKTAGKFDVGKWQAKMNTYNTPSIRAAVAKAVADGIIVGASVMDEPHQAGTSEKAWGPEGWVTKATIDDLCKRGKAVLPTVPFGVVHDYSKFEPTKGYAKCDFIASQYRQSKGDALVFAKGSKTYTDKYGMRLILMMNYLHGGTASTNCEQYGDEAEDTNLCPMTAAQIKSIGFMFAKYACAVGGFRYDPEYHTRSEIRVAMKSVADSLRKLSGTSCGRAT